MGWRARETDACQKEQRSYPATEAYRREPQKSREHQDFSSPNWLLSQTKVYKSSLVNRTYSKAYRAQETKLTKSKLSRKARKVHCLATRSDTQESIALSMWGIQDQVWCLCVRRIVVAYSSTIASSKPRSSVKRLARKQFEHWGYASRIALHSNMCNAG